MIYGGLDLILKDLSNKKTPQSEGNLENVSIEDIEKGRKQTELELQKEHLAGNRQDREQRKQYAMRVFWFLCIYMGLVFIILFLSAADCISFNLSENVLITLITTTTANVIGIFVFVVKYLFHK